MGPLNVLFWCGFLQCFQKFSIHSFTNHTTLHVQKSLICVHSCRVGVITVRVYLVFNPSLFTLLHFHPLPIHHTLTCNESWSHSVPRIFLPLAIWVRLLLRDSTHTNTFSCHILDFENLKAFRRGFCSNFGEHIAHSFLDVGIHCRMPFFGEVVSTM